MAKYLDENGLLYFWQKIKGTFAVSGDIPTDNSQLANGAGYQTSSQVQSAITTALNGITGIDFKVVDTLPASGVKGTIYLVAKSTSGTNNVYTEWIYVNSQWEQLGDTAVDLSGYLQTTSTIANTEIDTITSN